MTNKLHSSKTIDGLNLIFVELPKFQSKKLRDKKLSVIWLRYLTEMDKLMHTPEEKLLLPPEILEAIELTNESNFTPEQLLAYDKYLDAIRTEASIKADALAEGEAKALRLVARNLKKAGNLSLKQIAEATGLSEHAISLL